MKHRLPAFIFSALAALNAPAAAPDRPLAESTVVIYNRAVPESIDLAKFYAQKRGIARDHMIALNCSTEEEITRDDYEATIAQPLRDVFRERGWWKYRTTNEKETV